MFDWFKKKTPSPHGPDFSDIDSLEKAIELFHRGHVPKGPCRGDGGKGAEQAPPPWEVLTSNQPS